MASWISGIAKFLSSNDLQALPRDAEYQLLKQGLKNIFAQVDIAKRATPLSVNHLIAIYHTVDHATPSGASFWFGCLCGFLGLLRASEFCAGRLRKSDTTINNDSISLTLRYSKTSLSSTQVSMVFQQDELCPGKALANLLRLQSTRNPQDPLVPLSYNCFNETLKRHCALVGLGKDFSTHSLRRGGATAIMATGAPEHILQAHGRWASDAWRLYVELDLEQQEIPTRLLRDSR